VFGWGDGSSRISREASHSASEGKSAGEPHPKWARPTIVRQEVLTPHFVGIIFVGGFRTILWSFYKKELKQTLYIIHKVIFFGQRMKTIQKAPQNKQKYSVMVHVTSSRSKAVEQRGWSYFWTSELFAVSGEYRQFVSITSCACATHKTSWTFVPWSHQTANVPLLGCDQWNTVTNMLYPSELLQNNELSIERERTGRFLVVVTVLCCGG